MGVNKKTILWVTTVALLLEVLLGIPAVFGMPGQGCTCGRVNCPASQGQPCNNCEAWGCGAQENNPHGCLDWDCPCGTYCSNGNQPCLGAPTCRCGQEAYGGRAGCPQAGAVCGNTCVRINPQCTGEERTCACGIGNCPNQGPGGTCYELYCSEANIPDPFQPCGGQPEACTCGAGNCPQGQGGVCPNHCPNAAMERPCQGVRPDCGCSYNDCTHQGAVCGGAKCKAKPYDCTQQTCVAAGCQADAGCTCPPKCQSHATPWACGGDTKLCPCNCQDCAGTSVCKNAGCPKGGTCP